MPAPPPIAYSTLSSTLPSRPYILSIHPSPTPSSSHLILSHPLRSLTLADAQTLQHIETFSSPSAHTKDISSVSSEPGGSVWSAGHDGRLVRWDERTRQPGAVVKAQVRGRMLPVLSVVASEKDYLLAGGTELVSSEAHIMFWDIRNPSTPSHIHSSTHSDDITSLSFLPPSSSFLSSPSLPIPPALLLSSSTDGLLALSDSRQTDEDEALLSSANWGVSIARAGSYVHASSSTRLSAHSSEGGSQVRVWARSDIDSVGMWEVGMGKGDEGEDQIEMTLSAEEGKGGEWGNDEFKFREFEKPQDGPRVVGTAQDERQAKDTKVGSDYLAEVMPSLGVGRRGGPMVAVGNNEGDVVLLHQSASSSSSPAYRPSAFFLSGPGPSRGHKDVVRCMYHSVSDEALYTGSEDGVLSGWSLASLPGRLLCGDPELDDDGGDGREDIDEEEESEIETDEEEEDLDEDESMEMDDEAEERDGARGGPVWGGGRNRKEQRKGKRQERRGVPY